MLRNKIMRIKICKILKHFEIYEQLVRNKRGVLEEI